jgi:hypothetical protein
MKKAKQVLMVIICLALILPTLTLLIPQPADSVDSARDFRAANVSTVLFAWLHIGAAGLFLLAVGSFKEQLKRPYKEICGALLVLGLTQLQYPVLSAYELWYSDWVIKYAGLSAPNVIASLLMFLGLRAFARALHDTSWVTSLGVLPLALAVGLVGTVVLPPGPSHLETAVVLIHVVLCVVNGGVALRIKNRAGPAYTNALAWLFLALFLTALSPIMIVIVDSLHIERGVFLALPVALAGMLFVKAGYAFNKIREY